MAGTTPLQFFGGTGEAGGAGAAWARSELTTACVTSLPPRELLYAD